MNEFKQFLIKHDACDEALDWLGDRNAEQAWTDCQRGDWLLWIVGHVVTDDDLKKEIVKIALSCAKLSLGVTSDPRVHDCCHAVDRWLAGETVDLEAARTAANSAIIESEEYSERAAAWAVKSAAEAASRSYLYVVRYAEFAAWSAAWSAACSAAACALKREAKLVAARSARLSECSDIIRTYLPWTTIKPLLEQKMQGK